MNLTLMMLRTTIMLGLAFTASPSIQAACGVQDFKGTYGEIGWGAIAAPGNPLAGPFARVGRAVADGDGKVIAHTYGSFNGLIFVSPQPYSGTYTVSADCIIVFKMNIPVPTPAGPVILPLTLTGVIWDNGKEVSSMITDPPGLPVRILFHRQDRENCATREFPGTYGLDMFGNIGSGTFTRTGRVTFSAPWFDGRGTFTASTIANYNGAITPEALSGTYSVSAECELTMQYKLGDSITWFGGLFANSSGSTLMVVDPPGSVVIGTLQKQ